MKLLRNLIILIVIFIPLSATAELSQEQKIQILTTDIKSYAPNWTPEQTTAMLDRASHANMFSQSIATDHGTLSILCEANGNIIFVNGKEITNSLGNKISYGANSPIIEGNNNTVNLNNNQSEINKNISTASAKMHKAAKTKRNAKANIKPKPNREINKPISYVINNSPNAIINSGKVSGTINDSSNKFNIKSITIKIPIALTLSFGLYFLFSKLRKKKN